MIELIVSFTFWSQLYYPIFNNCKAHIVNAVSRPGSEVVRITIAGDIVCVEKIVDRSSK